MKVWSFQLVQGQFSIHNIMPRTLFSTHYPRIFHSICKFIGLVLTMLIILNLWFDQTPLELIPWTWSANQSNDSNLKNQSWDISETNFNPKIWISMAVCFSSNTHYYKKMQYPYKYALLLSTDLWLQITNHSILITIVHKETARSPHLELYTAKLNRSDRVKVILIQSGSMDCPLKSQIDRWVSILYFSVAKSKALRTSYNSSSINILSSFSTLLFLTLIYWSVDAVKSVILWNNIYCEKYFSHRYIKSRPCHGHY